MCCVKIESNITVHHGDHHLILIHPTHSITSFFFRPFFSIHPLADGPSSKYSISSHLCMRFVSVCVGACLSKRDLIHMRDGIGAYFIAPIYTSLM